MQSSQTLGGQANPDMHNIYSSQVYTADSSNNLNNDCLQSQDSFGQWMSYIMTDTPASVDDPSLESSMSSSHATFSSPSVELHLSSVPDQIFTVTDFSPSWACTAETTKVLVTRTFHEEYQHIKKSKKFCVCGDVCVPAEIVQVGVYRCFVLPNAPGVVNLYMSFDGQKPISQIMSFEYRTPILHDPVISSEDKTKWEDFQLQIRLAYLLFSKPKSLDLLSSKVLPNALKEAKKFEDKTSNIANSWAYLIKAIENNRTSFALAKDCLN
ncbi:hypothetical protein CFOL_v3_16277 [Cephalotus follicularis]|uniref:Uncharacterized protein n=1 Tax=Cephalotus follicularis TaxID=3775 RepID=A0A1Q3BY37_CEPFO|nr:hypothetical protein CFOL_v3_16277 [Cephalotus follicularis]